MPALALKQPALGGKGHVVSYVREPAKFYWRELVPGTKSYVNRIIPGASTIEEAQELCIEVYTQLRQEQAPEQDQSRHQTNKAERTSSNGKYKSRPITACVSEFLQKEKARVEAGLIKQRTFINKQQALNRSLLPYLESVGITHTRQITNNSFQNYPTWRSGVAKSTRRLELILIGNFLNEFCKRNGLLDPNVSVAEAKPKITIKESEIDANPPLIEEGNWTKVLAALDQKRKSASTQTPNHRAIYFAKLFYRWCIIMRNSGLRPNVELNQLKWCHIKRENVGTWSESEKQQVDKWIAVIYIRDSKTGRQRIVPTNGVDSHLLQWKKEQQDYIDQYSKNVKITDQSFVFGNPHRDMQPFAYSRFNEAWSTMIKGLEGQLKPYVFSDRNYTIYSLRSTYICNLIMQGKGIYDVSKLAGHTVAVCERYYARLSMGMKSREITNFEYGSTNFKNKETTDYL